MRPRSTELDLAAEAEALAHDIAAGDAHASIHLARLLEADAKSTLQPFTQALAEELRAHLWRWAERGVTDPEVAVPRDVYEFVRAAAAALLGPGRRPGGETGR
jgi:hypothetical protein